jgi:NifU-like protein
MTNIQRMHLIESVMDQDIRPILQADGGNIQLIDIEKKLVTVKFTGMCSSCPSSKATLEHLVEAKLKEKVDPAIKVILED